MHFSGTQRGDSAGRIGKPSCPTSYAEPRTESVRAGLDHVKCHHRALIRFQTERFNLRYVRIPVITGNSFIAPGNARLSGRVTARFGRLYLCPVRLSPARPARLGPAPYSQSPAWPGQCCWLGLPPSRPRRDAQLELLQGTTEQPDMAVITQYVVVQAELRHIMNSVLNASRVLTSDVCTYRPLTQSAKIWPGPSGTGSLFQNPPCRVLKINCLPENKLHEPPATRLAAAPRLASTPPHRLRLALADQPPAHALIHPQP